MKAAKNPAPWSRKRNTLVLLLALGALALGGYTGWRQFPSGDAPSATLARIELPDVEKKLRNGEEWLGKVVVVNHWATWCPPCREEIPLLIEYQRRLESRGVQIVGIAHDLLDATRAYGDNIGINYPSLVAVTGGNELMRQQGNSAGGALPFTAFFDRRGNLVDARIGQLSARDLDRALAPLLAGAPESPGT